MTDIPNPQTDDVHDEPVIILETDRLTLRLFTAADSPFVLEILNEESFIRNVGDRGVRTIEEARGYIQERFVASYEKNGYGLYATELKVTGEVMGLCGLVRRDTLPHPDIGFEFLPRYCSRGYALEAAEAVLDHARRTLHLGRIMAITVPENTPSIRLLEKIGLRFEKTVRLAEDDVELSLYAIS